MSRWFLLLSISSVNFRNKMLLCTTTTAGRPATPLNMAIYGTISIRSTAKFQQTLILNFKLNHHGICCFSEQPIIFADAVENMYRQSKQGTGQWDNTTLQQHSIPYQCEYLETGNQNCDRQLIGLALHCWLGSRRNSEHNHCTGCRKSHTPLFIS